MFKIEHVSVCELLEALMGQAISSVSAPLQDTSRFGLTYVCPLDPT